MEDRNPSAVNVGRLIGGINVLLVGLYILFCNFGWVDFGYFPYFWKLWPIIFIIIGLNVIFSRDDINYIGSLAFTVLLVILMVASSPGSSGTSTRAFLRIPEEPKQITLSNLGELFNFDSFGWHGEVKQTFENSYPLGLYSFPINEFRISVDDNHAEKVEVTIIPTSENQRIDYEVGAKKTGSDINKSLELDIELLDDYMLNVKGLSKADFYYDLKISVYYDPTASITTQDKLYDFEIIGDWTGSLDITNLKSGHFSAGNLEGSSMISTVSGDISCEKASNSTFKTTSGDINIGMADNTNMSSISGRVKCKSNSGNFEINTTSGDIFLGDIIDPGNARIKTISGEIEIDNYFATSGNTTINTTSGDVEIIFSDNIENSIRGGIATTSGDISSEGLDIKNRNFTIGNGDSGMMIRTVSGDINLIRSE